MSHTPWVPIQSDYRYDARYSVPIFEGERAIWHIFPEGRQDVRGALPICTVDKGDDHDPATRASAEGSARLIAAAPDLMDALKGVLMYGLTEKTLTAGLAAIAKTQPQTADKQSKEKL